MNTRSHSKEGLVELRDGLFYLFPSNDEMEIRRDMLGEPVFRLRDPERQGWIKLFFEELDGKKTSSELLGNLPEEKKQGIERIVSYIKSRFYVRCNDKNHSGPRWFRHLLARRTPTTDAYYEAFSKTDICVIGGGLLAKEMLDGLGSLRAGKITSIDIAYNRNSRADSSTNEKNIVNLTSVSEGMVDINHLETYLKTARHELIVLATDYIDLEVGRIVNDCVIRYGGKWMMCLIDGWKLYIGPTFLPGEGGCFECLLSSEVMLSSVHANGYLYKQANTNLVNPGFAKIASGLILADIVNVVSDAPQYLKRSESLTIARQTVIDLETFEVEMSRNERLPACEACNFKKLNKGNVL